MQNRCIQIFAIVCTVNCVSRPVGHSRLSPTPVDSALSHRQPTHIG